MIAARDIKGSMMRWMTLRVRQEPLLLSRPMLLMKSKWLAFFQDYEPVWRLDILVNNSGAFDGGPGRRPDYGTMAKGDAG
ncbi:MAG: hypothetical protein Ct9H300mP19_19650 [Dehalococcoidia bacterium]|nr:MAG: hypothetical protein Ct9H300mP19_19650 [Dehalococcoidia bacterium]